MGDAEELVTQFAEAMADLKASVIAKVVELREQPQVVDVQYGVDVSRFSEGEVQSVSIGAYIEADLASGHGAGWMIDLLRRGGGWEVERRVVARAATEAEDVWDSLEDAAFARFGRLRLAQGRT